MQALCKISCMDFEKGKYYRIVNTHSIFVKDDFIIIENSGYLCRFRLNKSTQYIEGYIGETEVCFDDYFININDDRKAKLEQLSNVTEL